MRSRLHKLRADARGLTLLAFMVVVRGASGLVRGAAHAVADVWRAARRAASRIDIDLQDAFVFGGLGCVGYGLHAIYPPAAWIVVGAALFWLGIRGS